MRCQILFLGKIRIIISKCLLLKIDAISAENKLRGCFSNFFQDTEFCISCKLSPMKTICMKCQILFPGKNKFFFQNVVCCKLILSTLGKNITIQYFEKKNLIFPIIAKIISSVSSAEIA